MDEYIFVSGEAIGCDGKLSSQPRWYKNYPMLYLYCWDVNKLPILVCGIGVLPYRALEYGKDFTVDGDRVIINDRKPDIRYTAAYIQETGL